MSIELYKLNFFLKDLSLIIGYDLLLVILSMIEILGGGFTLGSLVMVMEDPEAPHHMLLLRNFMSQGLMHHQPLIYASPAKDPRGFLGTLPSPVVSKDDKSRFQESEQVCFVYFGHFNSSILCVVDRVLRVVLERKVYVRF